MDSHRSDGSFSAAAYRFPIDGPVDVELNIRATLPSFTGFSLVWDSIIESKFFLFYLVLLDKPKLQHSSGGGGGAGQGSKSPGRGGAGRPWRPAFAWLFLSFLFRFLFNSVFLRVRGSVQCEVATLELVCSNFKSIGNGRRFFYWEIHIKWHDWSWVLFCYTVKCYRFFTELFGYFTGFRRFSSVSYGSLYLVSKLYLVFTRFIVFHPFLRMETGVS